MSTVAFERLLAEQDSGCAICGGPPVGKEHLSVDHCHETGEVRGLLCDNCNLAIGLLQDDPNIVTSARAYLLVIPIEEHHG